MDSHGDKAQGSPAGPHPPPRPPRPTGRERFFGGYVWLVLRNVLGWLLILAALVAGPLVPGPGGIPLFLAGFALVSFPGKRRLTARVLRGRPVRFRPVPFTLASVTVALVVPGLALAFARHRSDWVAGQYARGTPAVPALYLLGAAVTWLAARQLPRVLDLLLRLAVRARRRVRPWLRRHHVRLLPPRWRPRHPHEPGAGPFPLTDEILKLVRRR